MVKTPTEKALDNVIKALECIANVRNLNCVCCVYRPDENCGFNASKDAIGLLRQQNKQNERLKNANKNLAKKIRSLKEMNYELTKEIRKLREQVIPSSSTEQEG